jgi:hypothetical protein
MMIENWSCSWSPIGPTFGRCGSPACSATTRPFNDIVILSLREEISIVFQSSSRWVFG